MELVFEIVLCFVCCDDDGVGCSVVVVDGVLWFFYDFDL